MEKIPFAQFVINDITNNGMQMVEGFMGPDYYVDHTRETHGRFAVYADSPTEKDHWNLSIDTFFFFHTVKLYRGPEHFLIKLTKDQKRSLIQADKDFRAKQKENARIAKAEKEARRIAAQDWP